MLEEEKSDVVGSLLAKVAMAWSLRVGVDSTEKVSELAGIGTHLWFSEISKTREEANDRSRFTGHHLSVSM